MTRIHSTDALNKTEFHQQHFHLHKPVIHRGAIKKSKYFIFFSFDYLKSNFGSRIVKIAYSENGYYKYNDKEIFEFRKMPLSDAIDNFISNENSKSYYLVQTPITNFFPELTNDLELPPNIIETDVILNQNLWAGGSGCVSPLHYDKSPNFLVQVRGKKRLVLFSPNDSKYLYPVKDGVANHYSEINLENIDHERFPLFEKAKLYECVLEPGDILYIPIGWWHEVRSLDPSISINYWFQRFDISEGIELISVNDLCNSIRFFTKNGIDINSKDYEGEFLLIKAIKMGLHNVVEALLLMGVNPNSKSCIYDEGVSAISYARKLGRQKIIKLLIKHNAED